MSKSDSKSRILYIYRILVEETDSEHQITIQQIITHDMNIAGCADSVIKIEDGRIVK